MNRAERRALGVPKTVSANIEQAEKIRTVNQFSVAVEIGRASCRERV